MRDNNILKTLQEQPEKGLKLLTDHYTGYVYAIADGILGGYSRQDVEECVSDVFYTVYRQRGSIDAGKGSLKAYICTIARRQAIDKLRRLGCKDAHMNAADIDDYTHIEGGEQAHEGALENERRESMLRAIKALGATDANLLIRRYYFNQSNRRIADDLGMKENTVSKRITRALRKLEGKLDREDFI